MLSVLRVRVTVSMVKTAVAFAVKTPAVSLLMVTWQVATEPTKGTDVPQSDELIEDGVGVTA